MASKVMSRNSTEDQTTPNFGSSVGFDSPSSGVKEEAVDEVMTLEEFLAKADGFDVKVLPAGGISGFDFDPIMSFSHESPAFGFGNGVDAIGGKRGRRVAIEPLDKAAQQRQRRMIKNRESAAKSRERKQARQYELEDLVMSLKEENNQLLNEMGERTKERLKELEKQIVPVVEKRRPKPPLRRVASWRL